MPRTAVSTPLIRDAHRTAASTGTRDHHARTIIDRWAGISQPRHEQRELLDTVLPGPARPGAPAQEQHDRVRIRLRRGLRRVAAEPLMPQILIGDPDYLQILIQHGPIPLPGRQTHRECSHGLSLSGRQSETTTSHEHHTPGETPQHQPDRPNRATSRNRSGNPGEGLRIGELCGLHLIDLHLREDAACGQCRTPHVHVCHRPNNPNGAEAKTKHPWRIEDGIVTGGLIKRVSPGDDPHLFRLHHHRIPAWVNGSRDAAGSAARRRRAGSRGRRSRPAGCWHVRASAPDLGVVKPHAFRHSFTSAVLDASQGNLLIARDAGGWASAAMVDEIYGHVDVHDPAFDAALRTVWGEGR